MKSTHIACILFCRHCKATNSIQSHRFCVSYKRNRAYFSHSVTFKPSNDSYACMPCTPQLLYGRYAPFSLSIPAKKMKAPRKTQKNNNLKNTKYEMSTTRGPLVTFSLPGGRLALCPPRQLRHWLYSFYNTNMPHDLITIARMLFVGNSQARAQPGFF